MAGRKRGGHRIRWRGLPWIAAIALLAVAAGATGTGAVLLGGITGGVGVALSQAIVTDTANFTSKDITRSIDDKVVVFEDDGSNITIAGEFNIGDVFVLDVPLANNSGNGASAMAILDAPGLSKDIELFWKTRSRNTSPVSSTTLPSPAPLTSITAQSSDTNAAALAPVGTAGINPQITTTTGTTSSPGLPAATPQAKDGASTTTQPTGVQANLPQEAAVAATNAAPSGSTAVASQTANGAISTSQPSGLTGVVNGRTVSFSVTNSGPTGTPDIVAQTSVTGITAVQPAGAATGLSGTYKTGAFLVDINADGVKETVSFVLTDVAVSGTYDTIDLSTDDAVFGETIGGPLSGQTPRQTGPDDDERVSSSGVDVRLGPFYTFTVTFGADGSNASITAKTWFTKTVTATDLDGDLAADDTFHAALTDDDSDGIYEKLDLSIGDQTFGETAGGALTDLAVDFGASDNTNDEGLTATSDASSGSHHVRMGVPTVTFTWDTTPGGGA